MDRIYGNKGITLLLLDEALTIPFEVPRRYTRRYYTRRNPPPPRPRPRPLPANLVT